LVPQVGEIEPILNAVVSLELASFSLFSTRTTFNDRFRQNIEIPSYHALNFEYYLAEIVHKNKDFRQRPPFVSACRGEVLVDVDKMLIELRLEREQIEEAILTLERLARGRGRRRGRPPAWLKDAASASASSGEMGDVPVLQEPRRRGRPPGSKTKQLAQAEGS
jgi:hypothetical protein